MAAPLNNNNNTSNSSKNRRSNKPMMEKKRRERINKSLNTLKDLVLRREKKDASKFNKLEKADILEMSVKHIENLHENTSSTSKKSEECIRKYKEGFERCITELLNYLGRFDCNANAVNKELMSSVISHLKSISNEISKEVRCCHGNGIKGEIKVKAVIDKSVFTSGVLRHEQCDQERLSSPMSVNNENNNDNNNNNSKNNLTHTNTLLFPPSPPDSSRSCSPPDSLRESPRNFMDISTMDRLCSSYPYSLSTIQTVGNLYQHPLETESKPLNLTTSSHLSRQDNLMSSHSSRSNNFMTSHSSMPNNLMSSHPSRSNNLMTSHSSKPDNFIPSHSFQKDNSVMFPHSSQSPYSSLFPHSSQSNNLMPSHSSRQGSFMTSHSPSQDHFNPTQQSLNGYSYSVQCSSASRNIIVKQEAFSPSPGCSFPSRPPSYSPSGSFPTQEGKIRNLNGSKMGNALAPEAGGSSWRGHSLKPEGRPTPYPKKEAVKRYQNQNPTDDGNEIRDNFEADANKSHWRPW